MALIDLKGQASRCSAPISAPAASPAGSAVDYARRCAADVKTVERLLGDLRRLRRAALLHRLRTAGASGPELIRAVGSAPAVNWSAHAAARPLPPRLSTIAWVGLALAGLLGGLLGLWLGRRVEAAAAADQEPGDRDWRWAAFGIGIGWATHAILVEAATGATPATAAWSSRLALIAAGLLLADRLLRLWTTPRLKGQDLRPLKILLASRSGWLMAAFATGQMFRTIIGDDPAPAAGLLGLAIRSVSLVAAAGVVSVLLGAPFRPQGSQLHRLAIAAGLASLLLIDWAGGHALIQFLLQGAVGTVLCLLIYSLMNRISDALLSQAGGEPEPVMGALGIHPIAGLRHAVWLRFVLLLLALMFLLAGLLAAWGFADTARALVADRVVNGFEIAGVRVAPRRFLAAAAILAAFLILAGRMRAGAFGRWLNSSQLDPGAREAILRTAEYGGLVVAVLASVSFTGMSLKNTALIAGALSVGLGFGLQGLLANIVAGATLLFERSVRPGDWIEVAGADGVRVQGLVRSVRARATEIHTLAQAAVLVPNADLVGRALTNHTLRNSQGRVVVKVDADPGRDPAVLMNAFRLCVSNRPDLIQSGSAAPGVYLRSISDGRLRFEIEVSVSDFWHRQAVESELNLAFHDILQASSNPPLLTGPDP